jgi:protein O-GlcNAc transferase
MPQPHGCVVSPTVIEIFEHAGASARAGDLSAAEALCREAAAPTALLHFALGEIASERGEIQKALAFHTAAVELAPSNVAFQLCLGEVLVRVGRIREAEEVAERVVRQAPDLGMAHAIVGAVRLAQREIPEAIASYERAVALGAGLAAGWSGLGTALSLAGRLHEAADALKRAVELQPEDAQPWCGLLSALGLLHRFAEARTVTMQALARFPDADAVGANALFVANADPGRSAEDIFAEHRAWGARLAAREAQKRRPHDNARAPERRLRIGYLSPDFRVHSVAFFMVPIIGGHHVDQFEVYCYSNYNNDKPDRVTQFFRTRAAAWRDVAALYDDALAEQIRKDEIDILVDLAGYTSGFRPNVFAQKPAPIQVSYLGYPNTTGLPTMDYRITDAFADPVGLTEQLHTEQLLRPFRSFLCYAPAEEAPPVAEGPGGSGCPITFGSFNDYRKINPELVALWSAVLRAVPGSRMVIKTKPLVETRCRGELRQAFLQNGIKGDRIELLGADAKVLPHLARYASVDIALDTFPYHGTTTTCEALWMGVPVVTLAGDSHRSRVGVSLLHNVGLPELVAGTRDDFVRRAASLAGDVDRRRYLRSTLRERMRNSPVMDGTGLTRALEASYRQIWRRWCEGEERR